MSTFYKTGSFGVLVHPVEVDKATEFTVWIRGRQYRRTTSFERYWSTEAEAWDYLVGAAEKTLEHARYSVDRAIKNLDRICNVRAHQETKH